MTTVIDIVRSTVVIFTCFADFCIDDKTCIPLLCLAGQGLTGLSHSMNMLLTEKLDYCNVLLPDTL